MKNTTPIAYDRIHKIGTIFAIRLLRPGMALSVSKRATRIIPEENVSIPKAMCETNVASRVAGFMSVFT